MNLKPPLMPSSAKPKVSSNKSAVKYQGRRCNT